MADFPDILFWGAELAKRSLPFGSNRGRYSHLQWSYIIHVQKVMRRCKYNITYFLLNTFFATLMRIYPFCDTLLTLILVQTSLASRNRGCDGFAKLVLGHVTIVRCLDFTSADIDFQKLSNFSLGVFLRTWFWYELIAKNTKSCFANKILWLLRIDFLNFHENGLL